MLCGCRRKDRFRSGGSSKANWVIPSANGTVNAKEVTKSGEAVANSIHWGASFEKVGHVRETSVSRR